MEEAPAITPEFKDFINIKTFDVKIEELNYTLSISDNSTHINFSLTSKEGNEPFEYEESYNLEKLIKINNIFKTFESIKDARNSFEELINAKNYFFEKNNENINFILKIANFAKIIEVTLILRRKKLTTDKLINVLFQQINELKIENKNLKNKYEKDINELKKEIIEIKEQNNYLIDSLKKLKISEEKNNQPDDYFNFCFRKGINYTLSKDGKIAEKTSGGYDWNCTIVGDKEIPKNKLSKWKIKLKKFKINDNTVNTFIGVGPNNLDNKKYFYNYCWSLSCGEDKIWNKTKQIKYNNYPGNLNEGDIIEVTIDMDRRTLSFKINGIDYGIACDDIPIDEQLYPIVLINYMNQMVEIVD